MYNYVSIQVCFRTPGLLKLLRALGLLLRGSTIYWIPNPGLWTVESGLWILDSGFWILDSIVHAGTLILSNAVVTTIGEIT